MVSESSSTLESLKNPFVDELIEDEKKEKSAKKSKAKRGGAKDEAPHFAHPRPKNFIDLTNLKYPGIDPEVMVQIQEAFEQDYKEHYDRNGGYFMKKEEDSVMRDFEEMRHAGPLSAIKREEEEDIRNIPDKFGDFLQNIN